MKDALRTILRTAQTYFPGLADAKYELQRAARQVLRRPFERDFLVLRRLDLGPSPLLVDIGANRGQSIDAFRLTVAGARILAFEPNPDLAERLRRRYRGRPDVTIEDVGLGDREDRFTLHVPSYNGYTFDGLASFDEADAKGWLETRILRFDPARLKVAQLRCVVKRLDDYRLCPALLKVDVQGFEHRTLLGAEETIVRAKPVLLLESPAPCTVSYLGELGYRPYAYRRGALIAGATGEMNTFFLHPQGVGAAGAALRAPAGERAR
jgi:FkbM family methyltransferase